MTLRRAEPGDAQAICDIWNDVIRNTAITFTTLEKTVPDVATLLETRAFFVAEQDETVVGFASLGPFRDGPGYASVGEHSIYLQPTQQRNGLGRALMALVEQNARETGLRFLVAGIGGAADGSVAFHSALGFEKVGHLPGVGWKFDTPQDLIFMQKAI